MVLSTLHRVGVGYHFTVTYFAIRRIKYVLSESRTDGDVLVRGDRNLLGIAPQPGRGPGAKRSASHVS